MLLDLNAILDWKAVTNPTIKKRATITRENMIGALDDDMLSGLLDCFMLSVNQSDEQGLVFFL